MIGESLEKNSHQTLGTIFFINTNTGAGSIKIKYRDIRNLPPEGLVLIRTSSQL